MHLHYPLQDRVSIYPVLRPAPSLSPFRIVCLHTSCWGLHLLYPLQNRVSTYLVLKPAPSLSTSESCVYIPRVEACTFTIPFRIACLHTSCWGLHIHYPLQNRVSTYLVLKPAPSLSPSKSGVYISRVEACTFTIPFTIVCQHTSCWGEHLLYPLPNRLSTYLVLKPTPSLSPSQSCVYIPRVEACIIHYPLQDRVSIYLVLRPAPSLSPSKSCVYISRVEASTFSIPFTIECLHTSCWGLHLLYPLQHNVYIPRVEGSTFTIPSRIVCQHTSSWSLHLHYPVQNRVSTYLVLRPAPSLSPSESCVYIPRVEACTFTIPFTIVCLHTSCWGLHLHYPLQNRVSTYLVLKPAPSLSPSQSCVYMPRIEACPFTIPFAIVGLHTSCWSLHLHYPLQNRVSTSDGLHTSCWSLHLLYPLHNRGSTYLVLKPAPSLSPPESCVYIPRVDACTFSIPFTIVCLHTSCWGLRLHFTIQNRVSTYIVSRPAPSLSSFRIVCIHKSCWGSHLLHPLQNRVSKYLVLRPAPSLSPSGSCVYIPRIEASTFTIHFRIVCLHSSCWGTFYITFKIVCLHSSCWGTFYITFKIVCLHSPCWGTFYITFKIVCLHSSCWGTFSTPFRIVCLHSSCWGTLSTPFRIVCLHTSCWSLHLLYPLHNCVSTYLVLKSAPSISPSQSCVYIPRVEACTIPFRIVCLHTWYLVLKPAPSLSPSESCVYTPRVEATTFNIPFRIVCLHISCWGEHILYLLHNRVSTYFVLRRAPSLSPSQ